MALAISDSIKAKMNARLAFLPMYAAGFFCLSLQPMTTLLIPLWALRLGASPLMIGIVAGSGSIIPMIFSISSGALVDQLGSKQVLQFGSVSIVILGILPLLFPTIAALIVTQLLYGQMHSMTWISVQTYVTKLTKMTGDLSQSGIFSFAVSLGTLAGPLLIGLLWDQAGPWAAFVAISVWAGGLFTVVILLPAETGEAAPAAWELQHLLPRRRDYQRALSLLAVPVVALAVYATFLRLAGYSMRGSFYAVYLQQIAFPAPTLPFLFSFFSLVSAFAPLTVGFLSRWISGNKLLFLSLFLGLLPLSLTPLFVDLRALAALSALSGFSLGLTLPLLITVFASNMESNEQGIAVGLRTTANRVASAFIPLLFGLLAQGVGLSGSFYIVGALLLLPMLMIAPHFLRWLEIGSIAR